MAQNQLMPSALARGAVNSMDAWNKSMAVMIESTRISNTGEKYMSLATVTYR